ncbi:hypothetical protein CLOP_g2100 [Closterium sp. NIES-67]|nr:hypothetical protein CLOP_g2100 [Closterium sp. NIES-67]
MAGMNAAHGDELPRQRRKRRTKAQMAADRAIAAAFKRKRGRPSKSDVLARQALIMAAHSGMPVTDPSNIDAILAAQNASALVPTATAHAGENDQVAAQGAAAEPGRRGTTARPCSRGGWGRTCRACWTARSTRVTLLPSAWATPTPFCAAWCSRPA